VTLLSSYTVAEAQVNLAGAKPEAVEELDNFLQQVLVVKVPENSVLPPEITLVEKDRSILQAAINVKATHLLTGDRQHEGHLVGARIEGVLILPPADYLKKV
jgi:predicted nucleic acid-binding protein